MDVLRAALRRRGGVVEAGGLVVWKPSPHRSGIIWRRSNAARVSPCSRCPTRSLPPSRVNSHSCNDSRRAGPIVASSASTARAPGLRARTMKLRPPKAGPMSPCPLQRVQVSSRHSEIQDPPGEDLRAHHEPGRHRRGVAAARPLRRRACSMSTEAVNHEERPCLPFAAGTARWRASALHKPSGRSPHSWRGRGSGHHRGLAEARRGRQQRECYR